MPLQDEGLPALPSNTCHIRVRMHHTDLLGAVYHGTYFDLFENVRTEVFRALDYTYKTCTEEEGQLMLIVRAVCDYRRPARMDDLFAIAVTVPHMTRARLTFSYHVRLAESGESVAYGENVFAFLNAATNRPTSVPPRLATLIRATPPFGLPGRPDRDSRRPGADTPE
jgi:acyl-CoA thioester hydrolase